MKKAISEFLAITMILSVMTACNKSAKDAATSGSSDASASFSESESATTTEFAEPTEPEPTQSELLFRKNTEIEPGSYKKVKLDYSLDADGDYSGYSYGEVPLENSFLSLSTVYKAVDEYNSEKVGSYVMEYDYDGNRLDYYKLEEIDEKKDAYFLTEGDRVLIIVFPTSFSANAKTIETQVYDFFPEKRETKLLFSCSLPYTGYNDERKFDALVDGKLYGWIGSPKDPSNCIYQRYDLNGNLECETDPIDFTDDVYKYTEYYEWGESFEHYERSQYFLQGFWKEDKYYVMKSAEGESTFDVLCYDKDLKKIDEFQTDIDSMKVYCRGSQRTEYFTDKDGLFSWNENTQKWENILKWGPLNISWRFDRIGLLCRVLRNDRVFYYDYLILPGEPGESQEDQTIINVASTRSYGSSLSYSDEYIQTRKKYYDDCRIDDYGKIQPCSKIEAILQDFRSGDLDMVLVDGVYSEWSSVVGPKENMSELSQMLNSGVCLDLSPYIQPYIADEKKSFSRLPSDMLSLYQRNGKLCAYPLFADGFKVDTWFSNKSLPLRADATYSDWLEYARSRGEDKKLLCIQKSAFLEKCLSYDLYSFIDTDNWKACFDCQEFKDLLQLSRDYCELPDVIGPGVDPFEDAQLTNAYVLSFIGKQRGYKQIGLPSAKGTSYCLIPDQFVIISASSQHPDEAWKVLEENVKNLESYGENKMYAYTFSSSGMMSSSEGRWAATSQIRLSDIRLAYFPDKELIDVIIQEANNYIFKGYPLDNTLADINAKVQEILDARKAG